jgi:hypothetical protein
MHLQLEDIGTADSADYSGASDRFSPHPLVEAEVALKYLFLFYLICENLRHLRFIE